MKNKFVVITVVITVLTAGVFVLFFSSGKERKPVLPSDNIYRIVVHGESTLYGSPKVELGCINQLKYYLQPYGQGNTIRISNYARKKMPSSYVAEEFLKTLKPDWDLAIALSGHNEFLYRTFNGKPVPRAGWLARFIKIFWQDEISKMISDYIKTAKEDFSDFESYGDFQPRIEAYRRNIEKMIAAAQNEDVPLLLCTVPFNMFWPPGYKYHPADNVYLQNIERIVKFLNKAQTPEAKNLLTKMLRDDPKDPTIKYLLGRVHFQESDYSQAAKYFTLAKEQDTMRIRVLEIINHILRVLSQQQGVYLVDLEKTFERNSTHGIVGYELVADNCHPTPLGHYVIAREIIKVINENNLYKEKLPVPQKEKQFSVFLEKKGFSQPHSQLAYKYYLRNAYYHLSRYEQGEDVLLFKCETARQFLKQAFVLNKDDWVVWADLAAASFYLGDKEQGCRQLKHAIKIKGGEIELKKKRMRNLKRALKKIDEDIDNFIP